jgi:hypothetical protein
MRDLQAVATSEERTTTYSPTDEPVFFNLVVAGAVISIDARVNWSKNVLDEPTTETLRSLLLGRDIVKYNILLKNGPTGVTILTHHLCLTQIYQIFIYTRI